MKKKFKIFKYRIKRLITPERTKVINKMLNNIWRFCEPDFVNDEGVWDYVNSSGKIDASQCISCMIRKRTILKNLSLTLYDPTPDKYPAKYISSAVQNKMKILTNSTYGVI